jgi:steroid 5-alpha reductase family enzyme
MAAWSPFWVGLGAALAMMTLVWLASLVMRDASIIDVFWGLGFVVVAWIYLAARETRTLRGDLVVGLVTLWGLRLSLHIVWRGRGKGEDYRYREMRERNPGAFPFQSLVSVFWLQAVLLWAISAPLFQAQRGSGPAGLAPLDVLGLVLFALGFVFEAGGDWQLARFKRDPDNAGQVMDRGLWRHTRHPNYFGDFCVWWGFYLVALSAGAWWSIVGPLIMSFLLLRFSGVRLLERDIGERRPAYAEYVRRTNAFFPGPRRD